MKEWLKKGQWVQTYTARGSPRLGLNSKRWETNRERLEQAVTGVALLLVFVFGFWDWLVLNS